MRRKDLYLSPLLIFLLIIPSLSWAWSGMVLGVSDGDTIKVMGAHNKQMKIRLYGIDTPERGQAFNRRAKQFTSKLVYGKVVEVKVMDTDQVR